MSADPARRVATYADLVALPENLPGEMLEGDAPLRAEPFDAVALELAARWGE